MQHKPKRRRAPPKKAAALQHDESNWLVSYADMMTLLFGFFVLMYSLSRIDREKFDVVSKEVAKYFGGAVIEDPALAEIKKEVTEVLKQAGLTEGVQIASKENGISLRFQGELLFKSGSAELLPKMQPVVSKIVSAVTTQKAVETVRVEGHTDDAPIQSHIFPTNWELSAARATRVVRQFSAAGFNEKSLVAEGYGSSRPAVNNRDEKGSPVLENMKTNRRVIINISLGANLLAAKKALQSAQFSVPSPEKKSNPEPAAQPDPGLPFEEQMRIRMEAAERRLKQADEAIREAKVKQQELKKKEALQRQVENLERLVHEKETKAFEMNVGAEPSSERIPASPKDEPLSLEKGLQKLKEPGTQK